MNGVFEYLIGQQAFFDRVDLSFRTDVSLSGLSELHIQTNKPTLGTGCFYSRQVQGRCAAGKNPFFLKYGKSTRFPNVPAARLTLHSERTPLTAAQVFLAIADLTGDIRSAWVTSAELTFDLHHEQRTLSRH